MTSTLRILGLAAVLTLVCSLLGMGPASAGQTDPDPTVGAPSVGACYDLTYKQAFGHAAPKAPVVCSKKSTMLVTAVGKLPASLDWSAIDLDEQLPKAVSGTILSTCGPAARRLLGSDTRQAYTIYMDYWFQPTEAEIDAGARWFSCEVALTESTRLLPLPAGGAHKIGKKIPDNIARCAKRTKGGYLGVACSKAHQWRTTYATLTHGKLSDKTALKAARRACPRHVSTADWLYRTDWVSMKSFVVACLDKTRR